MIEDDFKKMDEELNLKEVNFDRISGSKPSFLKNSNEIEFKTVERTKIPREVLTKYIDEKMGIILRDIEYYDNLFKNYRNSVKLFKEKSFSVNLSDEEKLIQYQNELHALKELIIENSFLVPTIKKMKEDIVALVENSNQILVGKYTLDSIKKNLDEYIRIYSNHAYQGNQISILLREINKLDNNKNLEDMNNIDMINR